MSARRSQARRGAPGQQVRSRGLLVLTLVLIGAFVTGLAYLKKNTPVRSDQTNRAVENSATNTAINSGASSAPAQTTNTALAPAAQTELPRVKPKYDFYSELPKRQLVITKDDIKPRPERETKAPPPPRQKQPAAPQPAAQQPAAQSAPSSTSAAAKPSPPPATRQTSQPAAVEMPKIELISRRNRTSQPSANQSSSSSTTANTGSGGSWMIQAGAYSTFDDADRVRAKLSLLGIRARVEAGVSNNRQVHRVRIGPILSKDAAASVSRRLRENNIPSLLIRSN